jgi:two-component system, response regulator
MEKKGKTIAVADDDRDDREMAREAFTEVGTAHPLAFFSDGAELLEYLRNCAQSNAAGRDLPAMVILDLNMPRIDGRQALREIRGDHRFQHVPVVVMSTSRSERDIRDSYSAGANSFITKPARFQGLVDAIRSLDQFWFDVATLPE